MPDRMGSARHVDKEIRKRQAVRPASHDTVRVQDQIGPLTQSVQRAVRAPRQARSADILALQRTAGNRAVTSLLQAKLTVGPVGDRYEQEADRVADQVLSMGEPAEQQAVRRQEDEDLQMMPLQRQEDEEDLQMMPLQRQEDEEDLQMMPLQRQEDEGDLQMKPLHRQEDEEDLQMMPLQRQEEDEDLQTIPLQRREDKDLQRTTAANQQAVQSQSSGGFVAGPELENRLAAQKGRGSSLAEETRAFMEPRFGADFSGVRVHTGGEALQLTQELGAQAFTHGQNIYLGAGRYEPNSRDGKRLLAHELTHVVQQNGGQARSYSQGIGKTDNRVVQRWKPFKKKRNKVKEKARVATAGGGDTVYQVYMGIFRNLKKPKLLGGVSKAERRRRAGEYYLNATRGTPGDEGRKQAASIERAYTTIFKESFPVVKEVAKEKLEQARATWGGMRGPKPDWEDEELRDTEPTRYRITLAVARKDADWDKKFRKYLFMQPFALFGPLSSTAAELKQEVENNVGHAWVRLNSYVGPNLKELFSYGFYPLQAYNPETQTETGGFQGLHKAGTGLVRHPDSDHERDSGRRYKDHDLTSEQRGSYIKALQKAQERYKNPPQYILSRFNCTTFAREILEEAGLGYPDTGMMPARLISPAHLFGAMSKEGKSRTEDPEAEKKIVGEVKGKTEERRRRYRYRMDRAEALVQKKVLSATSARRLPLDDLKVLSALEAHRGKGATLLAEPDAQLQLQNAFRMSEEEERERLGTVNPQMPEELRVDPALATCHLSMLGWMSPNGLTALAQSLGFEPKNLNELREKLGLTKDGKGEREKGELGLGLGLSPEQFRLLTYVDALAYGRFKGLFEQEYKGKGAELNADIIIRGHQEANYDLEYVPKITSLGMEHLSAMLEIDKDTLAWQLHKVTVKVGASEREFVTIAGDDENRVTVYASDTANRIGHVRGGTRVELRDAHPTREDFVGIWFESPTDGIGRAGRVFGAHLAEMQEEKHEPEEETETGIEPQAQKPEQQSLKVETERVPFKEKTISSEELVKKGGLRSGDSELYRQIVSHAAAYAKWKKTVDDEKWQLSMLTKLRDLVAAWQNEFKTLSKRRRRKEAKRREAIAELAAQTHIERSSLILGATQKQLEEAGPEVEGLDPHHREAKILHPYCLERYLAAPLPERLSGPFEIHEFFDFVTELENQHDEGLEDVVKNYLRDQLWKTEPTSVQEDKATRWVEMRKARGQPLIPRIKYVEQSDRDQYKLRFSGSQAFTESDGPLVGRRAYIYVMTSGMDFYAKHETSESQVGFHHSSLLGGESVGAAGVMRIMGNYFDIDLKSGHYWPKLQHLVNAVYGMQKHGVPPERLSTHLIPNRKPDVILYGEKFLKYARTVKELPQETAQELSKAPWKVGQVIKPDGFDDKDITRLVEVLGVRTEEGSMVETMRGLEI